MNKGTGVVVRPRNNPNPIVKTVSKNPALMIAVAGGAMYAGSYLAPNDSKLRNQLKVGGAMVLGAGVGSYATQIICGNASAEKLALIDRQNATLNTLANILDSVAKITGVPDTVKTHTNRSNA